MPPAGSSIIDLKGRFVLPGFVDAHVHIASRAQARKALLSGVTTARSLGVAGYSDIGLRDLVRSGKLDGPEILAAGYHVRPVPDELFFLNEPSLGDMMDATGVRGADRIRRMVRALLERGVDTIKVVATERAGLPDTDPRKQVYNETEISAAVEAAGARNIPVAVHAHGDEGAMAAVRAGVRSIEHGTYLSDETIALMTQKGTFYVPTLAIVGDLKQPGGEYDDPVLEVRGRHMLPRVQDTARRAFRAGVRLVAATDSGYGPAAVTRVSHEIEELVRLGVPPMTAIQAGTSTAAALLGLEKRIGTLKPGLEADLVVVELNPLDNIVALQDVVLVISNGRIALNFLAR